MALFILRTFKAQDDEIQGLHLPVVFSAVMDVLNVRDYHHAFIRCEPNLVRFTSKEMSLELRHPMSKRYYFYRRRSSSTSRLLHYPSGLNSSREPKRQRLRKAHTCSHAPFMISSRCATCPRKQSRLPYHLHPLSRLCFISQLSAPNSSV